MLRSLFLCLGGKGMTRNMELLAPAGSLETLKAVILAGADAVYFGGPVFGARAHAKNLNREEIMEAIDFGHLHGKKLFLTVNTLLKEEEINEALPAYLLPFYEQGLDAVIVQDFGVLSLIKRQFPDLPIHTSTQMAVMGAAGAAFLKQAGASRIVLSRELSLSEIRTIRDEAAIELEGFVHGALCYSCSGQCLFSSMLGKRSGNRGRCAQPCRLPYAVVDANGENVSRKAQAYPLSPKDLCAIDLLPALFESGISSFKIEGRMKQTQYAAGVVAIYRKYMDLYQKGGKEGYHVEEDDWKRLLSLGSRSGFTTGYYTKRNGPDMITFVKPSHEKSDASQDALPAEKKQGVWGRLQVKKELPTALTVTFQDASATVFGAVPSIAQSRPVTKDVLLQKLQKTGNTPFAFETLETELEDGLFLSMTEINALRRQALDAVAEQYLSRFRRSAPEQEENEAAPSVRAFGKEPFFLTASAEKEEQIAPLLQEKAIARLYVDSGVFARADTVEKLAALHKKTKAAGKQLFYILPVLFRGSMAAFYHAIVQNLPVDGFLVKSYDALGFLLQEGVKPARLRIDHNLYTWSNQSRQAFLSYGIGGDTVPLELNRAELKRRSNVGSEMLLYGRIPLMTSAQCLKKNVRQCDHVTEWHAIKDRYGISFPVKNDCNACYNVIYNSVPLHLFSVLEELRSLGIASARLAFTTESGAQVKTVLEALALPPQEKTQMTYGHYKRGVE